VCGYALPPKAGPSLFEALDLSQHITSVFGDVRDLEALRLAFNAFRPTVVIHLAAQPLVRASYEDPVTTYSTNLLGTVHLLELARTNRDVQATIIVTTDKCYENREHIWPYREIDSLGGRDPYSNSKACAELVTSGYWWSYFQHLPGQGLASARAGNVVGGGDWSSDRLVPDLVRAFSEGRPAVLRHPQSVRPWQHVLEPIGGYLRAAEFVSRKQQAAAPPCWNFGPSHTGNVGVRTIAQKLADAWGSGAGFIEQPDQNPFHEANLLMLDSSKAERDLDWRTRWEIDQTLYATAAWHLAHADGKDMYAFTRSQLAEYVGA
jgi:CDP-glucose 4,6-dehydratase